MLHEWYQLQSCAEAEKETKLQRMHAWHFVKHEARSTTPWAVPGATGQLPLSPLLQFPLPGRVKPQ
eukprot:6188717-Pleurochrysis_carterae.AAC.1